MASGTPTRRQLCKELVVPALKTTGRYILYVERDWSFE
jgi:hypothetical protein